MSNRPHINFICSNHAFSYTSKNSPPKSSIPSRDYYKHARNLLIEFSDAEMLFNEKKYEVLSTNEVVENQGIYLSITSAPHHQLPLESFDTKDIHLAKVQYNTISETEEAVIFIPDSKRSIFLNKFSEYLKTISKDPNKNPSNKSFVNSIESIKLSNLKDFWTDDKKLYPQDKNAPIWWEVWIKKVEDNAEYTFEKVKEFSNNIKAELGNHYLNFFNNMVFLIRTSENNLEKSLFLMTNLLELRYVPETPSFFVNLNSKEQKEWVKDFSARLTINNNPKTSICILDTGINYNHPLLTYISSEENSLSYDPKWPKYDIKPTSYSREPYTPHGSMQAGIAGFGNLKKCLESEANIYVPHILESGRILPPKGYNKPELYGAIVTETSYKVEIQNTQIQNRIFSLAVSANSENTGVPSSWSSEIDRFTFGEFSDSYKRLFIISTGNNINLNSNLDLWDQAHLAKIEDPAQSWNAITVGSITHLTTITDPNFDQWQPWSSKGNISPSARSSVNWEWKKQAPLKPEFVVEGGNRLLSSFNPPDITNHDDVSLLTTSGDINFPFDSHLDSSAACALASHFAALVADKYPTYWPETIRALLVHSCRFNEAINQVYKKLKSQDNLSRTQSLDTILRTVGFGIPDIDKALDSSENHAHIVIQNYMKPFKKGKHSNITLNEWHLIELPWPLAELEKIASKDVNLKVTLSYFIEPNPQNKGYKSRFSYQSHGLRFKMIGANQSLENFKASINKEDLYEEYQKPDTEHKGWFFGQNLRTKGSIHSDIWQGTAAELLTMKVIAIYPVSGWWKSAKAKERWKNKIRYSLVISIDCKEEIDIYTSIASQVEAIVKATNKTEISIQS